MTSILLRLVCFQLIVLSIGCTDTPREPLPPLTLETNDNGWSSSIAVAFLDRPERLVCQVARLGAKPSTDYPDVPFTTGACHWVTPQEWQWHLNGVALSHGMIPREAQ